MSGIESLFTPFQLGRARLKNRFAMAPMTRGFSPGGVPGNDVAAYYRSRAEGGVGLIITEGTWIPHAGASDEATIPDFHGDEALGGWSEVCRSVHQAGGMIMPQLWHVGLMAKKNPPNRQYRVAGVEPRHVGPSGLSGGIDIPIFQAKEPMTSRDIDDVIDAFATAAASAAKVGFDGVALHGAHGYLIDQFLWGTTNRRDDRYGGGHADRGRFAADIIREIRHRTPPDFPIMMRISQWKLHDYDARLADRPEQLEQLLRPIVDAGIDLFDCSQRRFWEPAMSGSERNMAGWVRLLTGKPTMTVGSVGLDEEFLTTLYEGRSANVADLSRLTEMFEAEQFDLVGVGRALIADPHWVEKVRRGQFERIASYSPEALLTLV